MYSKVKNVNEPFGKVHNSCRGSFASELYRNTLITNHGKKSEQPNPVETDDPSCDAADSAPIPKSPIKERLRSSITSDSNLCFICNEETDVDHLEYASGGLGRCALDTAGKRLERCMNKYLLDKTHPWYKSARRLDLLLKGRASDIWAADVYTHKKCYINFAFCYVRTEKVDGEAEFLALDTFFFKISQNIL